MNTPTFTEADLKRIAGKSLSSFRIHRDLAQALLTERSLHAAILKRKTEEYDCMLFNWKQSESECRRLNEQINKGMAVHI
jgi:hypothetical protein